LEGSGPSGHRRGSSAFGECTGTLKVDGKEVQTITMDHTLPMILQWDESFDIGSDTLTGVNDADYKPPFKLTARLNRLTIKVDRPQLSPADILRDPKADRREADARGGSAVSAGLRLIQRKPAKAGTPHSEASIDEGILMKSDALQGAAVLVPKDRSP
jgi:hypothetical protein